MLTKREQWLWDNLTMKQDVRGDVDFFLPGKEEEDDFRVSITVGDFFCRWNAKDRAVEETAKRFEEICRLKAWGL